MDKRNLNKNEMSNSVTHIYNLPFLELKKCTYMSFRITEKELSKVIALSNDIN